MLHKQMLPPSRLWTVAAGVGGGTNVSLSFTCPNCGASIIARFLRAGDLFLCRSCQFRGVVPDDAVPTGDKSTLVKHLPRDQPPSPVRTPVPKYCHGYLLAGRGERFLARLAESVIFTLGYLLITFPAARLIEPEKLIIYWLIMISLFLAATLIIQAILLGTRSQSLGKLIVGIKIIRSQTGEDAGFLYGFFVREFLNDLISIIPFYGLVDTLLIFSNDRRCIHDHLAGTTVVKLPL